MGFFGEKKEKKEKSKTKWKDTILSFFFCHPDLPAYRSILCRIVYHPLADPRENNTISQAYKKDAIETITA